MNQACLTNPTTGFGAVRKWIERSDDYRERSIAEAKDTVRSTYTEPSTVATLPFDKKPDVSFVTKQSIMDALFDLGIATTTDLHEHPTTDRSKRQIRRALNDYQDENMVETVYAGSPPTPYYYLLPTGDREPIEFVSDERLDELGIDEDELGT